MGVKVLNVSECMDLHSILLLKTPDVLDALVSCEQVCFKYKFYVNYNIRQTSL